MYERGRKAGTRLGDAERKREERKEGRKEEGAERRGESVRINSINAAGT